MFCWNRKPLKVKVLSTVLYYFGLSYRVTARVLRGLASFSHKAVRLWFRRLKDAFPKPEKHILIAGDHLLPTITPNVAQLREGDNALANYLKSLEELEGLAVSLVLPAHEEPYINSSRRIQQLKRHHQKRSQEILNVIQRPLTPYQVASRIRWDVPYRLWEEFPPFQKYLAVGEAIAHLELLRQRGMAKVLQKAGVNYYVIAQ